MRKYENASEAFLLLRDRTGIVRLSQLTSSRQLSSAWMRFSSLFTSQGVVLVLPLGSQFGYRVRFIQSVCLCISPSCSFFLEFLCCGALTDDVTVWGRNALNCAAPQKMTWVPLIMSHMAGPMSSAVSALRGSLHCSHYLPAIGGKEPNSALFFNQSQPRHQPTGTSPVGLWAAALRPGAFVQRLHHHLGSLETRSNHIWRSRGCSLTESSRTPYAHWTPLVVNHTYVQRPNVYCGLWSIWLLMGPSFTKWTSWCIEEDLKLQIETIESLGRSLLTS